ncbi:hypothetical protein Tco_1324863 [Tanacetum coccineum]
MEEAIILEKAFDEKEVWDVVRGCGGDKAPGPDEGLNAIVKEAVEKGIFRGVTVGANNVTVSHLQYADDTIFSEIGIYGIGVNEGDMSDIARWMRCDIGEFPFTYLRLPIGENMGQVNGGGDLGMRGSLWVRVVKSIHGACGGLGDVRAMGEVGVAGCKVWQWDWVRDIRGRVSKEFEDLLGVLKHVVVYNNCRDRWRWTLVEDGEFTVKEITRLIEEKILLSDNDDQETLWNKLVPKKVNIFIWRALRGRLSCNDVVETCAHCLINCDLAMGVWDKIFDWWKVGDVNAFTIDELFSSNGNVNVPTYFSHVWQAVMWSTGYFIWKERNARVFASAASDFRFLIFVSAASDMRVPGSASSFSLQF